MKYRSKRLIRGQQQEGQMNTKTIVLSLSLFLGVALAPAVMAQSASPTITGSLVMSR